jgi:hypothetical protein
MEHGVWLKKLKPEYCAAITVCDIGAYRVVSGMNGFGESFQME